MVWHGIMFDYSSDAQLVLLNGSNGFIQGLRITDSISALSFLLFANYHVCRIAQRFACDTKILLGLSLSLPLSFFLSFAVPVTQDEQIRCGTYIFEGFYSADFRYYAMCNNFELRKINIVCLKRIIKKLRI